MRRHAGPVIIIVIATSFIGGVVVPNLLVSLNRDRQKRSMADIRSIATALEARAAELNTYAIDSIPVSSTASDFVSLTPVSLNAVERTLIPRYMRTPLRRDGWGNEFEVRVSGRNYAIRSRGSDGRADPEIRFNHHTTSFKEDLVFSDGNFIQYPEASCSQ